MLCTSIFFQTQILPYWFWTINLLCCGFSQVTNYTGFLYLFPNIISHQLFSKNFHKAIFVKVIIYVYFLIKITLWSWILCSKYGKIWNSSISIQLKRGCKYVDVTYYIITLGLITIIIDKIRHLLNTSYLTDSYTV